MKDLHVSVRDKIATYSERNGKVVCGNRDYQIVFAFDTDWTAYDEKTAVFIFGGTAREVKFTGNVCKMPTVRNSTECTVGVYVDDLATTTPAKIPCIKSILCEKDSTNTIVDVSATTATHGDVRKGETFYTADGKAAVGSLEVGEPLPVVTEEDNGKVLSVVDGAWAASTPKGGATELPVYDLTELGIPTIVVGGDPLELAFDTTALMNDLSRGDIIIKGKFDIGDGYPMELTKTCRATSAEGELYVITSIDDMMGSLLITTIMVMPGGVSINAYPYATTIVAMIDEYMQEALGGDY